MRLIRLAADAAAAIHAAVRRFAFLYAVGGPVGVYYALKLARIKRRMAALARHITCEKETNRAMLAALNFELREAIDQQQATSQAASEFWLHCEKQAGVQP